MADSRLCSIEGCGKPHHRYGWCSLHFTRWRRHGDPLGGGVLRQKNTGACSVSGCTHPAKARGLCNRHWLRWKAYGAPTAPRPKVDRSHLAYASKFYTDVVLPYDGDDCLIWPFSKSASGYATSGRGRVHRFLCEDTNGPPPSPKHQAAHSCGVRACVNRRHISWKTHAENMADKQVHGTSVRGERSFTAKLTESDVRRIREAEGLLQTSALAKTFNVSERTVRQVQTRTSWAWLD